MTYNYCICW